VIENELAEHDERLAGLPRILALSKADLVTEEEADAAADDWRGRLGADVPVLVTSSATASGLDALRRELLRRVPVLEDAQEGAGEDEQAEFQVFRPAAARAFEVERLGDGEWRVSGDAVERLIARHDLENDEALVHVEHRLRQIGGVVFELDPS
jgi:GTP-binding protein